LENLSMRSLQEQVERQVRAEWDSLLGTIAYWQEQVNGGDEWPLPLKELVEDAAFFAHRYRERFGAVVEDGGVIEALHRTNTDPWTVQHQAREALLQEWDTVRQALEQRQIPRYSQRLAVLEAVAAESINPIFPDLSSKTIVYFHKVFDITRFAFSRMPVIGVPFSALDLPESWLSIPHETGHYVFWNVTPSLIEFAAFYAEMEQRVIGALTEAIAQREMETGHFKRSGEIYRTWLLWMNEIFADIYGTLVAGPASGWGIQQILRSRLNRGDLYHSHEASDHPDPYIRPFIHIHTLRAMTQASGYDAYEEAADVLQAAWRTSWNDENLEQTLFTPDNWGSMREVVETDVKYVVDAILNTPLWENGASLITLFREGLFYTPERHDKALDAIVRLRAGETVDVHSPLEMGIIAQLALVDGVGYSGLKEAFTYEAPPAGPEEIDRGLWFEEFIANATGNSDPHLQLLAWRRIIGSTASEVAYGGLIGHHHPHSHG
jgi:hypothetical protein